MSKMEKLSIPQELSHPFFFSEKEICIDLSDELLGTGTGEYFNFELLFYNGIVANKPWTKPELFVPQLHEEWHNVKIIIEQVHHERKKDGTIDAMKKGVALFLKYLFWSNGKPVCLKEFPTHVDLIMKPVNIEERAGFIIARPNLYHSFVQLCELMVEQEKLFAKNNIIKKASSRKS